MTSRVEYNKALYKRGSVALWIDDSAIGLWQCNNHHGKRSRGCQYSGAAIEAVLIIKGIFSLLLLALKGFIDFVFEQLRLSESLHLFSQDKGKCSRSVATLEISWWVATVVA
nr:transposase [Vibrio coralliirubri]